MTSVRTDRLHEEVRYFGVGDPRIRGDCDFVVGTWDDIVSIVGWAVDRDNVGDDDHTQDFSVWEGSDIYRTKDCDDDRAPNLVAVNQAGPDPSIPDASDYQGTDDEDTYRVEEVNAVVSA